MCRDILFRLPYSTENRFQQNFMQQLKISLGQAHRFAERLFLYTDMLFLDHGIIRRIYSNRAIVAEGVERSSHPTPLQVAAAAKRGIRTIINLRGACDNGSCVLSQEACQKYGIHLVNFKALSRKLPTKDKIFAVREIFDTVEYPVLMHCKSGADRVGLMSALYLLIHEGQPVEKAMKQLSLRYGHVRQAKTGLLDFFLETYRDANAETPIDFMVWVEHQYDPVAIREAFRSRRWADVLINRLLCRE